MADIVVRLKPKVPVAVKSDPFNINSDLKIKFKNEQETYKYTLIVGNRKEIGKGGIVVSSESEKYEIVPGEFAFFKMQDNTNVVLNVKIKDKRYNGLDVFLSIVEIGTNN